MDGATEKLDLYDFFGVFLAGVITILMMIWLKIPVELIVSEVDSEWIKVILFLSGSYLLGLVLREIGTVLFGCKRKRLIHACLKDNTGKKRDIVITNQIELREMQEMAKKVLRGRAPGTDAEYEYIIQKCRNHVYYKGKGERDKRRSSYIALSRSLFLSSAILTVAEVVCIVFRCGHGCEWWRPVFIIIICGIMLFRTLWFEKYRILEILRVYYEMEEESTVKGN